MPAQTRRTRAKETAKTEAQGPTVEETTSTIPREGTVHAKIAWVQQHVQNVEKTGQVAFGRTSYRHMQEHGLIEVLRPLLREVGLSVLPDIKTYERQGNMLTIFGELVITDVNARRSDDNNQAVNDQWQVRLGFVNEGVDDRDKASNKALTGWMKYALQKAFLVPTEGIDDNDNSEDVERRAGPPAAAAPSQVDADDAAALREAIKAAVKDGHLTNARVKALLQGTYNVESLEELSAEDAAAVGQWVEKEVKAGG